MRNRLEKFIPLGLFLISGTYFWALSSKIFTWIYTSGDAGDWLVQTNWWMVPQCWGKPFYVLLIHFVDLFPGDPVHKITALSILGGAIMVALTYMIAKKMAGKVHLGLIASAVVMGSNIILTQSTVLEQYTVLGACFLAFFYFYINERWIFAAMFLGLTAATHELGLIFTVLFIVVEARRFKMFLKYSPIYILFGLVPYGLILWMMASPETPKLLAGFLSWGSINAYGGNTTVTAALALSETPNRLKEVITMLATGFGFALVPVWIGFKKPWSRATQLILLTFAFSFWFYFTNLFPSTWKFLVPTLPLIICMAMIGLQKLPNWHKYLVAGGAIVLIIVNSFLLNSNTIAHEDPKATEYLQAVRELPEGSAIITPRGGAYGFTLFYVISDGREDLIPLALCKPSDEWLSPENNQGYIDYLWWLEKEYGIEGDNTYEIVKDAMAKGHPIYYGTPMTSVWETAFVYEDNEQGYLYEVSDVLANPTWPDTSQESVWGSYWQIRERSK